MVACWKEQKLACRKKSPAVPETTKEKLTFVIFAACIIGTVYLITNYPQCLYISYTCAIFILLPYRWVNYVRTKSQYYFLEMCYFVTYLTLLYLWLPYFTGVRGRLFPALFTMLSGPMLMSMILEKDEMVLQSDYRMTTVFLHFYGSLSLWAIKWHMPAEDVHAFPLCTNPSTSGSEGCHHVTLRDIMTDAMIMYAVYTTIYVSVIFVWRKQYLEENQYETNYNECMADKHYGPMLRVFGVRYSKAAYILGHSICTAVLCLVGFACYHYPAVYPVCATLAITSAIYRAL